MLKAKGEIQFTVEGKNYEASNQFRIAFKLGEGLLFSGSIISNVKEYVQGQTYSVDIEFFTVEDEAYSAIKPSLGNELDSVMCAGRKILGVAKLWGFEYDRATHQVSTV